MVYGWSGAVISKHPVVRFGVLNVIFILKKMNIVKTYDEFKKERHIFGVLNIFFIQEKVVRRASSRFLRN